MRFCRLRGIGAGVEALGGRGLGGGGDKNVIHIASMPEALVFTAFAPLYKDLEQENLSQASTFRDHAQNTGICSVLYPKTPVFTAI